VKNEESCGAFLQLFLIVVCKAILKKKCSFMFAIWQKRSETTFGVVNWRYAVTSIFNLKLTLNMTLKITSNF
jgi:hypothetical protein